MITMAIHGAISFLCFIGVIAFSCAYQYTNSPKRCNIYSSIAIWLCIFMCCFIIILTLDGVAAIEAKRDTSNSVAYMRCEKERFELKCKIAMADEESFNLFLYDEVVGFNTKLKDMQEDCQNPFIGIFRDQSILKSKPIKMSDIPAEWREDGLQENNDEIR